MTITTLDDLRDPASWQAVASGQARLDIASAAGPTGPALCLDFDFAGGGGFVVARRPLSLSLPRSYRIALLYKSAMPPNGFELKLVDPSGANVWRYRLETLEPAEDWRRLEIPGREIPFAWGPAGGGAARAVGALEIAIVAGSGGRGSLLIGALDLEDRTPPWPPRVLASAARAESPPESVLDGRADTAWRAGSGREDAWLTLDQHRPAEYGGVILRWAEPTRERAFRVAASDDGETWSDLHVAARAWGACSFVAVPRGFSRFVRVAVEPDAEGQYPGVTAIELQEDAFSRSPNELFHHLAAHSPRGHHPRWLGREQTYWTAVDVPDGGVPALLNEDGAIEIGPSEPGGAGCMLEPFLFVDDRLLGWAELAPVPSLEQGVLPIPSVRGAAAGLRFEVTAFADDGSGQRLLVARYRVANDRAEATPVTLFVAVRPFQVSPPWQGHGAIGGVTPIERIEWINDEVLVNGRQRLVPTRPPSGFGASIFDQGPITERLARGELPGDTRVDDPLGYASAALRFDLQMRAGATEEILIVAPFSMAGESASPASTSLAALDGTRAFARSCSTWSERLGRVRFDLPPIADALIATARTALGHILVNRDGPALQPGPRRYTRSWIRDGAVMSAALLRMGLTAPAIDFVRWYAGLQTPGGDVPCCVDHQGPDGLVEHDSLGELLFAIAEPVRFTGDRALAAALWPVVLRAVARLESLRAERLTDDYRAPERLACRGLLPESVSHEGYLAQPVHAYWDDFWAVRGLKDAIELAALLGETAEQARWERLLDAFRASLYDSIDRTMAERGIDFIPGSVEWADADPTAIAMALTLIDETHNLPSQAVTRTFDRFMERFRAMHQHRVDWTQYSPYEIRVAGALTRLGGRDQAHEVLDVLLADRRPPAWHQWPEIIWRDPRAPGHQGDLPHAWISAEYILAVRDLFVHERGSDQSLVIGAGLPARWLDAGPVRVANLPTWYGCLDMSLERSGGSGLTLTLGGLDRLPPGGLQCAIPHGGAPVVVTLEGEILRGASHLVRVI